MCTCLSFFSLSPSLYAGRPVTLAWRWRWRLSTYSVVVFYTDFAADTRTPSSSTGNNKCHQFRPHLRVLFARNLCVNMRGLALSFAVLKHFLCVRRTKVPHLRTLHTYFEVEVGEGNNSSSHRTLERWFVCGALTIGEPLLFVCCCTQEKMLKKTKKTKTTPTKKTTMTTTTTTWATVQYVLWYACATTYTIYYSSTKLLYALQPAAAVARAPRGFPMDDYSAMRTCWPRWHTKRACAALWRPGADAGAANMGWQSIPACKRDQNG